MEAALSCCTAGRITVSDDCRSRWCATGVAVASVLLPIVCLLRSGSARAALSGLAHGRRQGAGPRFLGLSGAPSDAPARHGPPGPVRARFAGGSAEKMPKLASVLMCAGAPEGFRGRRAHGACACGRPMVCCRA